MQKGDYLSLRTPRELSQEEFKQIRRSAGWHYRKTQQENSAINSKLSSAKPAEGTLEQLSEQCSLSDLPVFSRDSELRLHTNMISPNPSDVIQMLEDIDRALGATEKTIQRFTQGLKNTTMLLARDLFSPGSEIEEGETSRVYGAVGKRAENKVTKMVSNHNSPPPPGKKKRKRKANHPISHKGTHVAGGLGHWDERLVWIHERIKREWI